jgi:hypothetical protein
MTSEIDEFRQSLVAAVQAELERHASAVVAEVDRLREEGARDRAAIRAEMSDHLRGVKASFEQSGRSEAQIQEMRATFDQRLAETEARQSRRLDDMMSGLDGLIQAAIRPVVVDLRDDQEAIERRVESLDVNLRKFDEQAARMVTYFNDVSQTIEQRQDEQGLQLKSDLTAEINSVKKLVEENDSSSRRFQSEISQSVSQRVNDAEDRFNNRLLAAESRMKEEAGQKIAEIDVHVGRVSAGIDETMIVLNDRISAQDDRFIAVDRRMDEVEQKVKGVDQAALDELKAQLSTAAGEAMLVRIEMERFEKTVNERSDKLAIRVTDVETQLADATMDVSTSIQLDRLEEIERALIELDPNKFVLKEQPGRADDRPDAYAAGNLGEGT